MTKENKGLPALIARPGNIAPKRIVKVPMWARAREYSDEVLKFWAGMMRDTAAPEATRLRASENIMDRAYGKAPMIVLGEGEDSPRVNLSIMTAEQSAALESALMTLLGDSLRAGPVTLQGHTELPAASDIAASDADKERT